MSSYDVIVIGAGGVGSSAAMHLARRGAKVLSLEQFDHGHARGSSHGQSRAIRMAYFEHPDYVPLLRRAYELWFELEQATRQRLFHQVGLLEIGPRDGLVLPGVRESARLHQLPVEELGRKDIIRRFPQFRLPHGAEAVFESNAGFLLVEECVLAHLAEARKCGAELRSGEAVVSWEAASDSVRIRTTASEYRAAKLVIAAGAWSSRVLASLEIPLRVIRKHLHWFAVEDDRYSLARGTPTFFFELADRSFFYGFPQLDERGVKIAEHSNSHDEVSDPATVNRAVDEVDRQRVAEFVAQHLPGVATTPNDHSVCMYTMTPSENFVVDLHTAHANVAFAAGLSGHGFKFTSVLGEVLADLALNGRTELPIGFLSASRFA
jgi:sarcosine oxidase